MEGRKLPLSYSREISVSSVVTLTNAAAAVKGGAAVLLPPVGAFRRSYQSQKDALRAVLGTVTDNCL